jgi:transposase
MRWKPHVRFGGRAGETHPPQGGQGAPVRSHLANAALDEVRRRTQQASLGHRGRKPDPLYRIRRRLLTGRERLNPAGFARMLAWLNAGDPDGEVGATYLAKELLRETYLANNAFDARRRLAVFYGYCTSSDVPELERLARTIARWEVPILRWHRTRLTNAATEGTNLVVKNIKRLGFGFRNFENYRLRLLLRCGTPWLAHSPRRINTTPPTTLGRVEPTIRRSGSENPWPRDATGDESQCGLWLRAVPGAR